MAVIDANISAINLFKYLREVVRLKSKTVYNLCESSDYEEILWLKDIPKEKECVIQLFAEDESVETNICFKIQRPKLNPPPIVPIQLKPWIKSDIEDSSKELEIRDRIYEPNTTDENSIISDKKNTGIFLDDNPQLFELWCNYLDNEWKPWAKESERLKKIQNLYSKLHYIYQSQKNLSETYEAILGIGLLKWKNLSNRNILRHLLVADISIELDARGTIIVMPTHLRLEQDMLEINERPSKDVQDHLEELLHQTSDNLDDKDKIVRIFEEWINDNSSEGKFFDDFEIPEKFEKYPIISLSPAIMLRKRNERSFIKIYDDIIAQIETGAPISNNIGKILGINHERPWSPDYSHEDHGKSHSIKLEEIYFPKDWNDKQIEIVEKLNSNEGLLVQGPPGTGKSHTIANLICHLLANGKKILITSQAPRALKVLKNMLPDEIKDLVVNLLGQDSQSQNDLKNSVEYIIDKQVHWDEKVNQSEIDFFKGKRYELRKKESELSQKIYALREKETYIHEKCAGGYTGTAKQIAQKLNSVKEGYEWLNIDLPQDTPPPFTNTQMLEFITDYCFFSEAIKAELQKDFPIETELPSIEDFISAVEIEKDAKNMSMRNSDYALNEYYAFLSQYPDEELSLLKTNLNSLLMLQKNISNKYSYSWVPDAVQQILSEADRTWRTLLDTSTELLDGLLENAKHVDDLNIEINIKNPSFFQIKSDTEILLKYYTEVGKISFFTPMNILKLKYLLKKVIINGKKVNSAADLKQILLYLDVKEKLAKLQKHWNKFFESNSNQMYQYQVQEIEDLCEPLQDALKLHTLINDIAETLQLKNIPHPCWSNPEDVENYLKLIHSIEYQRSYLKTSTFFDKLHEKLSLYFAGENYHPILTELQNAISSRDEKQYNLCSNKISQLNEIKKRLKQHEKMLNTLCLLLPPIMDAFLQTSPNDLSLWENRFTSFEEAWYWAQTNTWLKDFLNNSNEDELRAELRAVQKRIKSTTAKLTSSLSLRYCISAINENPSICTYLREFIEATKRIGKGTGKKRAPKYRKIAKEKLQKCRPAIPAWIMPVLKVAETYSPTSEQYDVVIIDEASQCSVDALFLLYIAKKIIVVGDNEQISPEFYGVNDDDVNVLIEQYIPDLPHKEFLGVDGSFYDFANIIFPQGHIQLNEHFRCVPEIIQFSNQLSYHNRLDMLRQFPPDRLEPAVKCINVQDGFTDGSLNDINRPEAERLVQAIVNCCKDARYTKKTADGTKKMSMGVITLKGNRQDKLINQLLLEKLGSEEIEARNIICGNPYAFQGDERDVIFLSMVSDLNSNTSAQTSDKAKRRFNVAASRARDQMWLFHTPTINDFRNKECLRYQLLEYCNHPKVQPLEGAREECESDFEKEVYDLITAKGYRVIPQYEMNRYRVDLMVEGLKGRIAVECDGDQWHSSPEQQEADARRQRQLERAGLEFWRIRGSKFYYERETSLEPLWELLKARKIMPDKTEYPGTENIINFQSSLNNKTPLSDDFSTDNEDILFDHTDNSDLNSVVTR
ncbi:MAG: AAA domain-containing protein [Candidatus Auribacterota bacterium]